MSRIFQFSHVTAFSVLFAASLLVGNAVRAQSDPGIDDSSSSELSLDTMASSDAPSEVAASFLESSSIAPLTPSAATLAAPSPLPSYVFPSESQRLQNFQSNAIGPGALVGSAIGGAIDQAANFPSRWGQGSNAYGMRVASNLGISLVTATSQYALSEAFHEDVVYYRCACRGFLPRFWHAAYSSVVARRGADGHDSFSVALTVSPFIGPLVAANVWIPSHDGARLGLRMGEHNLMGQFATDEAQEFLFGGAHTLSARLHRLFTKSSN